MSETKSIDPIDYLPGASFVVLLCVLLLLQGGFYAEATCAVGIVIVLMAIASFIVEFRRGIILHVPLAAYLFLGIVVSALIGSFIAGMNANFVTEASIWPFAAGAALLSAFALKETRESIFNVLGWVGIASACLAILMFAGIIPFEGSENLGRLQFTFQYANAAGIWFAVMAALAMVSEDKRLRICAFFPQMALLLTQSGGSIVVFVIVCAVILFRWGRQGLAARSWALLMQLFCAIAAGGMQIVAIPDLVLSPLSALGGFALLLLLRRFLGPALEDRNLSRSALLGISLGLFLFGVAACMVMFALTGRIAQASQTFVERMLQTQDAFELAKGGLLFGTGPGSWAYLYQGVQTVQYIAWVVHNSYAQILLDSGIIGLALFLGIIARGVMLLLKECDWRSLLLAAMMVVHFLVDFDLQFSSLLMLCVFFIVPSYDELSLPASKDGLSVLALSVVSILCLVGCVAGLWVQVQKNDLYALAQSDGWQQVRERLEEDDFLTQDPEMRVLYLQCLLSLEEYEQAVRSYYSWDHTTTNEATFTAYALYQANRPSEAEEVLVEKLFEQPKNIDYFTDVAEIFETKGASELAAERYAEAAALGNQSAQGMGSLKDSQKPISSSWEDMLPTTE